MKSSTSKTSHAGRLGIYVTVAVMAAAIVLAFVFLVPSAAPPVTAEKASSPEVSARPPITVMPVPPASAPSAGSANPSIPAPLRVDPPLPRHQELDKAIRLPRDANLIPAPAEIPR